MATAGSRRPIVPPDAVAAEWVAWITVALVCAGPAKYVTMML
jgi:hypothetical protein